MSASCNVPGSRAKNIINNGVNIYYIYVCVSVTDATILNVCRGIIEVQNPWFFLIEKFFPPVGFEPAQPVTS